jgi:DNA topoisomerase-1
LINRDYGAEYLPNHPIYYKSKKTAQEAHEAIRPTSVDRTPDALKNDLEPDLWKLYSLIWSRFIASQMKPALFDQTDITIEAGRVEFKAVGSIEKFKGFLTVYQETKPEENNGSKNNDTESVLPELHVGDVLEVKSLTPAQHFTQPPPRYTEASLVTGIQGNRTAEHVCFNPEYYPGSGVCRKKDREILSYGNWRSCAGIACLQLPGNFRLRVYGTYGSPAGPDRNRT